MLVAMLDSVVQVDLPSPFIPVSSADPVGGILMAWLFPGVSRNYSRDWLPARPEEDQGSPSLALKGHPAPELMVAMTKDYPNDVIYGARSRGSVQGDSCLPISPPAGGKKGGLPEGRI